MADYHHTKEYRIWRAKIIRRDKKCLVCDSMSKRVAHHINSASYFKDDMYKIENGVCLCERHHIMYHTSYNSSFRKKTDVKNFCNFLEMMIKIAEETGSYNKEKMKEFKNYLEAD